MRAFPFRATHRRQGVLPSLLELDSTTALRFERPERAAHTLMLIPMFTMPPEAPGDVDVDPYVAPLSPSLPPLASHHVTHALQIPCQRARQRARICYHHRQHRPGQRCGGAPHRVDVHRLEGGFEMGRWGDIVEGGEAEAAGVEGV